MTVPLDLRSSGVPGLRARFRAAPDFEQMMEGVTKYAELWAGVWRRAVVGDEYLRRVAAVPGHWHLLVLSEDWCGDAVNTVPVVAKLVALSPNLELRVLPRDENLDLMDAHLTGTSRSIPVVILLDEEYREQAWWGPRPTALQDSVSGEWQGLRKASRYRGARGWEAPGRGRPAPRGGVSL